MRPRRALVWAASIALAALTLTPVRAGAPVVPLPKSIPADLWELLVPPENPVTPEKVALGRKLFFEKRLSSDGTVSCATCHDPAHGFSDGKKVSEGVQGKKGARNAPTVLNAVFNEMQFWDGRAPSLEEQSKGPMTNPVEMGAASHDAVVAVVRGIPEYKAEFQKVFGREPTIDDIAAAIASFERTVVSGDSPFDRFKAGDKSALSESAQRGWELWNGKARCNTCHPFGEATPNFSDNKFHNIGVAAKGRDFAGLARRAAGAGDPQELAFDPDFTELGRFVVTRQPKDIGAFKTSGLRDVALSAPYMHDGSEATLLDVINFYDKGGEPNPYLDGGIVALKLTDQEKKDLVAFMESLTGEGAGAPARAELLEPEVGKEDRDEGPIREVPGGARQTYFEGVRGLGRRDFLKAATMAAAAAVGTGKLLPHSFQPVDVVNAAAPEKSFRFAYISDTHLYEKTLNDRFVRVDPEGGRRRQRASTRSPTSSSTAAISRSSASPSELDSARRS